MENPIIDKLRKLINMERSAREIGSIAEAEAFASKVQELLDIHKLSMSEVDFDEREQEEPIEWEDFDMDSIDRGTRQKTVWQLHIAMGVALANTCAVVAKKRSNSFTFVGRKSDRELCKVLFVYLLDLAFEMCEKASRENREAQHEAFQHESYLGYGRTQTFGTWMRQYKASWYAGFAVSIYNRFKAIHNETKAKYVGTPGLVHINNDEALVKKSLKDNGCRNSQTRRSVRNNSAYATGKATGESVSLSSNRLAASGRGSRLLN
jgi:hypothetical protein